MTQEQEEAKAARGCLLALALYFWSAALITAGFIWWLS